MAGTADPGLEEADEGEGEGDLESGDGEVGERARGLGRGREPVVDVRLQNRLRQALQCHLEQGAGRSVRREQVVQLRARDEAEEATARKKAHEVDGLEEHEHIEDERAKRETHEEEADERAAPGAVDAAQVEQHAQIGGEVLEADKGQRETRPDRVARARQLEREQRVRADVCVEQRQAGDARNRAESAANAVVHAGAAGTPRRGEVGDTPARAAQADQNRLAAAWPLRRPLPDRLRLEIVVGLMGEDLRLQQERLAVGWRGARPRPVDHGDDAHLRRLNQRDEIADGHACRPLSRRRRGFSCGAGFELSNLIITVLRTPYGHLSVGLLL